MIHEKINEAVEQVFYESALNITKDELKAMMDAETMDQPAPKPGDGLCNEPLRGLVLTKSRHRNLRNQLMEMILGRQSKGPQAERSTVRPW